MVNRSTPTRPRGGLWPAMLAGLSILLLAAAALMMAGSGPAYRGELISLGEAFSFLRNGVYAAGGAVAMLAGRTHGSSLGSSLGRHVKHAARATGPRRRPR